mmetsp:Transcript_11547/g.33206  ORF Transcript_11547/g.33206 Transcript_11547/m.33206 type:complete len:219 (+) Transcript_11547:120-776(+)
MLVSEYFRPNEKCWLEWGDRKLFSNLTLFMSHLHKYSRRSRHLRLRRDNDEAVMLTHTDIVQLQILMVVATSHFFAESNEGMNSVKVECARVQLHQGRRIDSLRRSSNLCRRLRWIMTRASVRSHRKNVNAFQQVFLHAKNRQGIHHHADTDMDTDSTQDYKHPNDQNTPSLLHKHTRIYSNRVVLLKSLPHRTYLSVVDEPQGWYRTLQAFKRRKNT